MAQRPPLPLDVVLDVVPLVDRSELLQLSSVSRAVSEAACHRLYRDLVFSDWRTVLHFEQQKLANKYASCPRTLHLKGSLSDDWGVNDRDVRTNGVILARVIRPFTNLTSFTNHLKESPKFNLDLPRLQYVSVCLWSQLRGLLTSKPTEFRFDACVRWHGDLGGLVRIFDEFQLDWAQLKQACIRPEFPSVKTFDIDLRFVWISGMVDLAVQKEMLRALPRVEKIIVRVDEIVYDMLARALPAEGICMAIGNMISPVKTLKVIEVAEHIGSKPHSDPSWRKFWRKGGELEQYCKGVHPGLETYSLREENWLVD